MPNPAIQLQTRPKGARPHVICDCRETPDNPVRTKQSFRDACDMNKILAMAEQSGLVNHVNTTGGSYLDCSNVVDYQTAVNLVNDAEDAFNALPAAIRKRFENDPAEILAFLGDEKNLDEAIEIGLIPKPVDPPTGVGSKTPAKEEPELPLKT